MYNLASTSDKIQVITGSAGAIHAYTAWADLASTTVTPDRTSTASIATATTTDIIAAPAAPAGVQTKRKVKVISVHNASGSVTNAIIIQHTDGTTVNELWVGSLAPGERVVYLDGSIGWVAFTANGVPKSVTPTIVFNASTTSQGAGFAADTYVTGSFIVFPVAPKVGTKYRVKIDVSKTGAGTATPILIVRFGTAGSTADTARNTCTFNAGTANADVGYFEIEGVFRSVGGGTSAVFEVTAACFHSLSATGLINTPSQVLQVTSGGFDSTVASLGVGASLNGGTSASWTVQGVYAEVLNAA